MVAFGFSEIGIVMIVATVGGVLAQFLRQPLIPAYIIAGVLIGPIFGLVQNPELVRMLSEIGVLFLLFIVGLEFDFHKIKDVGTVTLIGGTLQIFLLFITGFVVGMALGFDSVTAVYLGVLLAFSSTMVVVKLISDKKELETLHGRMVLAMLLLEDAMAIIAITALTLVGGEGSVESISILLVQGAIFALMVIAIGYFLLPHIFKRVARSTEILFLSAVAVCFAFSMFFSYVGLSASIGAFLAGVLLGNLPYNIEIVGRVKPLRDFFATLFFASLGMQLTPVFTPQIIIAIIVFVLLLVILKPLLFATISSVFGYRKHPVFMAAISLSQTSEFSLIIIAQALALGAIDQSIFTLAIVVAIISFTATTYFLKYDDALYQFFAKPMSIFDRFTKNSNLDFFPEGDHQEIVLCGYNRVGFGIFKKLKASKEPFLVVDFNPEVIRDLIAEQVPCIYGDIGDQEILERLNMKKRKMIISTIYDEQTNKLLIRKAREENPKILIFVTAYHVDEALNLYNAGADYVILPHFLGGDHVSLILEDIEGDVSKLIQRKVEHIEELYQHHHRGSHMPGSDANHHYHQQSPHKPHHKQ